jgi:hypothetical protein
VVLDAPTLMPGYAVLIVVLFTFSSTIFYILLLSERRVWGLLGRRAADVAEGDIRFVHRVLNLFITVLPPSNLVTVIGGLAALLWQAVARDWDWRSVAVLVWYAALQLYIVVIGRIATAIRNVKGKDSEGPLDMVRQGVTDLVRQHRNGFIHAFGVLVLELALIVL